MYEGKYMAKMYPTHPNKWMSVMLYAVNIILLLLATVRVFSIGGAASENKAGEICVKSSEYSEIIFITERKADSLYPTISEVRP